MSENFELIKCSGAILCKHVADGATIQIAIKTEPVCAEDSGWQFLCGCDVDDDSEGKIWNLKEVIDIEPSLLPYLLCEEECYLVRDSNSKGWKKYNDIDTT